MKLPFISKPELERLSRDVPTPFHLYDETIIRQRARRLKAAFAWNPGFREYFAVKANPNPALLRILMSEGFGLDCSSHTELLMARAVGAKGHDIMFSSNVTPEEDMRLAAELGSLINLDDISHIDFLDRLAGIPETISLRFNPGNDFTIGNSIMSRPGDAKYGFTSSQLADGIRDLKTKGARRFSLHAFLSSNTTEAAYYPALARLLFRTAAALYQECDVEIAGINLSGGIGVPYHPDDTDIDMMAVGRGVQKAFEEIMVPAGLGHAAIHTELGRWLLAPAGCLVSRVIHEKHIYKDYLGLDACAADLMRPAIYGAYHHITVAGREQETVEKTWDVTGGLCENNDKFAIDRPLPRVGIGDLLVIHDTGAHGHAMGYNYNGKLRSAEVLRTESGDFRMIRRAEVPGDYFATLDVLEDFRP
jgi:diaminopimelate decarboxylase